MSCSSRCGACGPCTGYGLALQRQQRRQILDRALRRARRPGRVVAGDDPIDPVPHADDLWVSDEDVLDYVHWISRRADALDLAINKGLSGPQMPRMGSLMAEWVPWVTNWRAYAKELEGSWWARGSWRAGAWDRCVTAHNELRRFLRMASEAGLQVQQIGAPPTDLQSLTNTMHEVQSAALPTYALVLGGIVAAVYIAHKL